MTIVRVLIFGFLLCFAASASLLPLGPFYPSAPVGTGQQPTDWGLDGGFLTDGSVFIDIPKFNPALGTLTSVTFTLTGIVHGDYNVTSAGGGAYTFNASAYLELTQPDLTVLVVTTPTTDISPTLDPGVPITGTMDVTLGVTGSALDAPATLALFTGTGNISLPVSAFGTSGVSGPPSSGGVNTTAGAYASVVYEYDAAAVPEPSLMGAVGAALLLAVRLRRRQRN